MPSAPSVKIWWSDSLQGYCMTSPFNLKFKAAIESLIPHSDRSFIRQNNSTFFIEKYLDVVKDLAEKVFGASSVVVISKSAQQKASTAPQIVKARVEDIAWEFIKILPFDAAQSAYRKAAMLLHPDRGGDMEKMSLLNQLWEKLSKEVYKQ